MQITRERVVGEIAKLTAERNAHLAAVEQHGKQIEQIAAQINCVDGCLIQCRAMLTVLDAPEPETPEQPSCGPYIPPVAPPAPEMLPVEIPAEADDLSLVERASAASEYCDRCDTAGGHAANCPRS